MAVEASPPAPPPASDSLWARSIRFAITVTAPIALNLFLGPQPWLVYALIASIAAYSMDNGGGPRVRLLWICSIGVAILLGAGLGSLVYDNRALTILAFAFGGMVYALSESGHQATITLSRFFCFGLAIGALYAQIRALDVVVVFGFAGFAWLVSVGWDFAVGTMRPASLPDLSEIVVAMHARLVDRWTFAIAVPRSEPSRRAVTVMSCCRFSRLISF